MQQIQCRHCGTLLSWDGISEQLRCEVCGAAYRMHPRGRTQEGASAGQGKIAPIRITQGSLAGTELFACFVPKGWTVETNAPEEQANVLAPLTPALTMQEPEGRCYLSYYGTQIYQHLEPTPQNEPLQGQLQHPGLYLGLCYEDALSYCDGEVAANQTLSDVQRVSQTTEPDAFIRPLLDKAIRDAAAGGLLQTEANWARCVYSCRDGDGRLWYKQLEAMISLGWIPPDPQEQMLYQTLQQSQAQTAARLSMLQARFGGAYNAMQLPTAQMPQPKLRWCLHFLMETTATEDFFEQAKALHDQVRESWKPLPAFSQQAESLRRQLQMQAMQEDQMLAGVLGQMNQAQMASWERKQGIVNDLTAHTSTVMGQIQQSSDATMQRVRNRQSEQLREVNTFHAVPGIGGDADVVEADIGWDHVYQNTQNPDIFAASVGAAPLEFGVDFEELKPTEGNY